MRGWRVERGDLIENENEEEKGLMGYEPAQSAFDSQGWESTIMGEGLSRVRRAL